jgi:integrase
MKLVQANWSEIEDTFAAGTAKGKRDQILFDDDLKGFGLRQQGNRRTWIVQYRSGMQQRRLRVGDAAKVKPNAAREAAQKILAQVDLGSDPQQAKYEARDKARETLHYVIGLYLQAEQSRLRPTTFYETKRYLQGYFPNLQHQPIDAIEKKVVATRLREIENSSGKTSAARARSTLSTLFVWAMREGLCERNPVADTHDPARGLPARNRVLEDFELAAIWNNCRDDDFGHIIHLLILTGQRMREVGEMQWAELDKNPKWIIPGSRTKNKQSHELIIPPAAWEIIANIPRTTKPHLFGRSKHGFTAYSDCKALLDQRLLDQGCKVAPWTIHDIRRTVATRMADIGVAPHIIETVLNHISGHRRGVAGVYNQSRYESEVKVALERWADRVRLIVKGIELPDNVIQMEKPIPA